MRSQALANAASVQKDEAKKQEYLNSGFDAYKHVVDGVEHLKTLPPEQLQGRPFSITPNIALNIGRMQLLAGENDAAAATLKTGFNENYADIVNSTTLWDTNWYSALISRSYELAQQAFTQKNDDGKQLNLKIGLEAYRHITTDLQGQAIPSAISLNAGRIQFMAGQTQVAAATLKLGLSEDYTDATNREIARWYLAAQQKANTALDQDVYNKLIAADPAEVEKITEIASTSFQE